MEKDKEIGRIKGTHLSIEFAKSIRALAYEAWFAGDFKLAIICDYALLGDPSAIAECERVLAAARAEAQS